jgi:hypothetical protein
MSKQNDMLYYTVRLPIDWEDRISAIQKRMNDDPPMESINIFPSTVLRIALRLGIDALEAKYGGEDGR